MLKGEVLVLKGKEIRSHAALGGKVLELKESREQYYVSEDKMLVIKSQMCISAQGRTGVSVEV